jgi:hypothetical protein
VTSPFLHWRLWRFFHRYRHLGVDHTRRELAIWLGVSDAQVRLVVCRFLQAGVLQEGASRACRDSGFMAHPLRLSYPYSVAKTRRCAS